MLKGMKDEPILVYLELDEQQRQRAGSEEAVLQWWRKAGTNEVALVVAPDAVDSLSEELRSALATADHWTIPWPPGPTWQPDWPTGTPGVAPYGPGST